MKKRKIIQDSLLFILLYMLIAFTCGSANPFDWNMLPRFILGFVGIIFILKNID